MTEAFTIDNASVWNDPVPQLVNNYVVRRMGPSWAVVSGVNSPLLGPGGVLQILPTQASAVAYANTRVQT